MKQSLKPVAVIGGGITGLTAAFYLYKSGIPSIVFEASDRVGGSIRSLSQNGYLAESGPTTMRIISPRITNLVHDLGLDGQLIASAQNATTRYLVRYGRLMKIPDSPLEFLTSNLLTLRAKFSLLCEPFVPVCHDREEESIADFIRRRLGREIFDYAVDAMVAGIYAGDPEKLSVQKAFPKLSAIEANYGSLIKGKIATLLDRKKRKSLAHEQIHKFSFNEGLQVLPERIRTILGDSIFLNTTVISLKKSVDQWIVQSSSGGQQKISEHSAVIYAGTAHQLANLKVELEKGNKLDLTLLSEIRHPPVASVVLGYRRQDVAHPCQGFGVLIPKVEKFKILGTIFSSSLFPNRAPIGHLTLTTYLGGERNPEIVALTKDELFEVTHNNLKYLLGIKNSPTFRSCSYYPKSIPQYNLGYGRYQDLLNQIEKMTDSFFFAGHYRDGISLGDSILSGCKIVERVVKILNQGYSLIS